MSFLYRIGISSLFGILLFANPSFSAEESKPNIVFIFADDWGWGDLSCHGHPWLKTPNLDRLARQGTDFQQFNVLNPVCSPSRTAVMTGHYPARYCIHQHFAAPAQNHQRGMPDWLDPQAPTLPRFLKQASYCTAHFGKWHLTNRDTHGSPRPEAYGYDEFAVFNGGAEWPSADLHATAANTVRFIKANGDGEILLAALKGEATKRTRPIFWEWLGTKAEPDYWPRLVVRDGDWKLVMTDDAKRAELHRIPEDRAEATDVAKDNPKIVARLTKLALDWKATLPGEPNPDCRSKQDAEVKPEAKKPAAKAARVTPGRLA